MKELKKELPKGFFDISRPHVKKHENKDKIIPIKWSEEVLSGKKKTICYSAKEKII